LGKYSQCIEAGCCIEGVIGTAAKAKQAGTNVPAFNTSQKIDQLGPMAPSYNHIEFWIWNKSAMEEKPSIADLLMCDVEPSRTEGKNAIH
jgi:hypothetical protein